MNNLGFKRKLILGTASFKTNYGLNFNSRIQKDKLKKIFNDCLKNEISFLDTANNYKLNKFSNYVNPNKFKIIFKVNLKVIENNSFEKIYKKIFKLINNFLKKNNLKKIYCIMIHSEKLMLTDQSFLIYKALKKIKSKGYADKIGISGYNLDLIKKILLKFKFDILQFPYNLFDQRLNKKKNLDFLKKRKIELHIRSIYLQGLFFQKIDRLPKYFSKWKKKLLMLEIFIKENNLSMLALCLSHANNLKYKNKRIIFGINSYENLLALKNIRLYKNTDYMIKFNEKDKDLILPYLWKIKKT
tara:strand:+ start:1140 stop:2039 length:900 start_codon:yes stop_codon:yes gene_type:complete